MNCLAADADYSTTTIMATFVPSDQGMQEFCGIIPITDDMIGNEPNKELSVTPISSDLPGASFGDRESCITIIDDDGECLVCIQESSYQSFNTCTHIVVVVGIDFSTMESDVVVNENNGTVTVCLMKNITTDGPITVVFDAEEEHNVSNSASGQYCTHSVYNIICLFCAVLVLLVC